MEQTAKKKERFILSDYLRVRTRAILEPFVKVLSPFAPHLAEELWEKLGHTSSLAREPWPVFDGSKLARQTIEVVLQVNGKVRDTIEVNPGLDEKSLEARALQSESVKRHMEGKQLVKAIVVKNKLVNLVVR